MSRPVRGRKKRAWSLEKIVSVLTPKGGSIPGEKERKFLQGEPGAAHGRGEEEGV